jgi:hypothetical protein
MNWREIPYRQRNIGMLICIFVFVFVAYFTTIRKTVVLYTETNRITQNIGHERESSYKLNIAEKKYKNLNSYLRAYTLDSLRNQQYIMSQVSDLCKAYNLTLRSFPRATIHEENNLRVETTIIETAGAFNSQLKLLYELETAHVIGRVSSVRYSSYVDNKSKKTILLSTIYLQNVKSHDEAQL